MMIKLLLFFFLLTSICFAEDITINEVNFQAGCSHIQVNYTIDGVAEKIILHKQDLKNNDSKIIMLLRVIIKNYLENTKPNWTMQDLRTFLLGKTFKI